MRYTYKCHLTTGSNVVKTSAAAIDEVLRQISEEGIWETITIVPSKSRLWLPHMIEYIEVMETATDDNIEYHRFGEL